MVNSRSHDEQPPLDLEEEQNEIDKLIQSLLQFKPITKNKNKEQISTSSSAHTPKAGSSRSTRGRPRPQATTESPTTPNLSTDEHAFKNIQDLLVDCLKKVNLQNKSLVNRVSTLEATVDSQRLVIDKLKVQVSQITVPVNAENNPARLTSAPTPSHHTPAIAVPSRLAEVVNRVEKIENKINSCQLLCRGPTVSEKISSSTTNGVPNLRRLKAEICMRIFGGSVTQIGVDSFEVSVFGKNRNILKLECRNSAIKDIILKEARLRKPDGLYVAEFLSAEKLVIYNRLFKLKKQFPDQVKAVYTRRGTIFGKIGVEEKIYSFECVEDVAALDLPSEGTAPPPPATLHPPSGSDVSSGSSE